MKKKISGRDACYMAIESSKRQPISLEQADNDAAPSAEGQVPAFSQVGCSSRLPPPRVRKPQINNDSCLAPTPDLEMHRDAMRKAFGDTLSNEFAEVMLGKLVAALRPGPYETLDEATLNAAIALVASINARNELQAVLAVQIAATSFAGLKFLRQSQVHMTEDFIAVYGGYATKLLRLQLDLITTLDRHRLGNKQTVEVRHVHIHSVAQGVVGIVNSPGEVEDEK